MSDALKKRMAKFYKDISFRTRNERQEELLKAILLSIASIQELIEEYNAAIQQHDEEKKRASVPWHR